MPSLPVSFTLTPAAMSSLAISMSPFFAANISGVNPLLLEAWTSARPSTSTLAISGWGSATAHMSAVLLVSVVSALTFAPRASSDLTTSTFPVCDAIMSGVIPLICARFGSAPAFSSRSTILALAFSAARASGVTPWSSAAFTLAPDLSSRSTVSRSSQWAAKRRAVAPSGREVLTLTPCLISARTAALSWSAAAVTSRRSASAARATRAVASRKPVAVTVRRARRMPIAPSLDHKTVAPIIASSAG